MADLKPSGKDIFLSIPQQSLGMDKISLPSGSRSSYLTFLALISDHLYMSKPDVPEIDLSTLGIDDILLKPAKYQLIQTDVINMVVDVVTTYLPQLSYLKTEGTCKSSSSPKTIVVLLPCLPFSEAYLQDDVKVLSWYQNLFQKVIEESGGDPNMID